MEIFTQIHYHVNKYRQISQLKNNPNIGSMNRPFPDIPTLPYASFLDILAALFILLLGLSGSKFIFTGLRYFRPD
jgi:hypothetical protein